MYNTLDAHDVASKYFAMNPRLARRNVFIYNLADLSEEVGGLMTMGTVTHNDLYIFVEVITILSAPYFLQNDSGDTLLRDSVPIVPGNYFIVSDRPVLVNNTTFLTRSKSIFTGTR